MARCVACPFRDGENEEATTAQNLGCLPTAGEMVKRFDTTGQAFSCHDDESVPCRGLARHRKVAGAPLLAHTDWYRNG